MSSFFPIPPPIFVSYKTKKTNEMKRPIQFFALTGLLFVFFGCGKGGDSKPGSGNDPDPVECQWMAEDVSLDSIAGCAPGNMKTRYLSQLRFHLDLTLPDDLPADADEVSISFDFSMQAPGQLCGNGTPMNAVAWLSTGESATITIDDEQCVSVRDPSVEVCGAVDLTLPIESGQRSVAGGICIVLETIDPKSVFAPELLGTDNWIATVEDVDRDVTLDNTPWTLAVTNNSAPANPDCAACTDPG